MTELAQKYTEAYWKIKKSTDIGSFVISDEATSVLTDLKEKPKLDWNENPSFDIFKADYNFYQEALYTTPISQDNIYKFLINL